MHSITLLRNSSDAVRGREQEEEESTLDVPQRWSHMGRHFVLSPPSFGLSPSLFIPSRHPSPSTTISVPSLITKKRRCPILICSTHGAGCSRRCGIGQVPTSDSHGIVFHSCSMQLQGSLAHCREIAWQRPLRKSKNVHLRSPYNVRSARAAASHTHGVLPTKNMTDVMVLVEDVLRKGGNGHLFSFRLQLLH